MISSEGVLLGGVRFPLVACAEEGKTLVVSGLSITAENIRVKRLMSGGDGAYVDLTVKDGILEASFSLDNAHSAGSVNGLAFGHFLFTLLNADIRSSGGPSADIRIELLDYGMEFRLLDGGKAVFGDGLAITNRETVLVSPENRWEVTLSVSRGGKSGDINLDLSAGGSAEKDFLGRRVTVLGVDSCPRLKVERTGG